MGYRKRTISGLSLLSVVVLSVSLSCSKRPAHDHHDHGTTHDHPDDGAAVV